MKKLLLFVFIASTAFLLNCGSEDIKSNKSAASKPKVKKVDGKKIYKMNCVICHGADGKLGINGAKDITISNLSDAETINLIKKGKGAMTPFESILTEKQIKAVLEYTNSL
ncbi:MAG: cytochrome c [Saprospiraceae bacterium]